MEQIDEEFLLGENEKYEKVCGEILLTTNKRIAVHCTMCEAKYKSLEAYITHVFGVHVPIADLDEDLQTIEEERELEKDFDIEDDISSLIDLEEKPNLNFIKAHDFYDICDVQDNDVIVKMEIEPIINEALEEEELPLSMLKKERFKTSSIQNKLPQKKPISKVKENEKEKVQTEKSVWSENEDLIIPTVIREVKKRNAILRKCAPDEEKKHKCPICGLGFKERHNMRYHFKRHSNDKKHECPDCGKKFYTPSEVRVHMRFHANKREFLCSDCGRAFKTRNQLLNHIKRHKNQRDFKCKTCPKAFFDLFTLRDHVRVHTLERPFSCKICNATFARSTALRNHVKLHENKRAYKCNLCEAGFNQQAGLFSHMKVTHKVA